METKLKKLNIADLSRRSLSEQVYEALQNSILTGDFKAGDPLPEVKLSEELGVSRTPVREAIGKLEQEGLVRTLQNRGAVVVGITEKDIDDIYAIRMVVEGLAAKWASENTDEAVLEEMRGIVELQEFYVNKKDYLQVRQLDSRFHSLLYKASGSHILTQVLSSLHRDIRRVRELSVSKHGRAVPSVQEHRAIFSAVEAHDGALAERLMYEHILNAHKNIRSLL